jgi:hypothetical protein
LLQASLLWLRPQPPPWAGREDQLAGALLTLARADNSFLGIVEPLTEQDLDGTKRILEMDILLDRSLTHRRNAKAALLLLEEKRKELKL